MNLKSLIWMGSSKEDLLEFPDEVKKTMGYALHLAQSGDKHPHAKVLKGFGNAGIIEIVDSDPSGTYRVVYTVKIAEYIFVLHSFQKKSKQGIKTTQKDINLIEKRLRAAQDMYKN
jgi:phage-related protein